MTAPRVRRPILRAAGFGALAAALVAAACEAPQPMQPNPGGTRRLYASEGAQALPAYSPAGLQAALDRYFPQVVRHGMRADEVLLFVVSPTGEVVRHERARVKEGTPRGALSGIRETGALRGLRPDQIRSVDVLKQAEGVLAPTRTQVVWVQLNAPGQTSTTLNVPAATGPEAARADGRAFHVTTTRVPAAFAATVAPGRGSAGTPDEAALRSAMQRFYTPAMVAAGVTGEARVEYTVGADGKARDVSIYAKPKELEPVVRSVVASLTLQPGAVAAREELFLHFGPSPLLAGGR